jgi:selenocysteine-specific elongation factor
MARPNRHVIIGTAGHVDHGKTELVKALTGVNTDRLKEEQERGISIELGFAELKLPSGDRVGLIDVPGHERFVKAMVAGAAGMDLGMLIVAADESVMPQTREHLDILQLLELKGGVVVLTKADLVDEETLDVVDAEVEDLVRGTFLERAPRVRVSAKAGRGLDELREALDAVTAKLPPRPSDTYFRLPIDRAFTIAGAGLLVTGTAWSGRIHEGDTVDVLPAGLQARVRGIQVHGEKRETAFAGERVALNLHGPKNDEVERGMVVATSGMMKPTFMLDVTLRVLPSWPRALVNRTRVRIHHGANELFGRVVLLDRDELLPGDAGPAQLRLESPLAAERGDRIVLRQYSPMRTLGGAVVLDAAPTKHKRFRDDVLEAIALREKGGADDLVRDAVRRAGIAGVTQNELRTARIVPEEAVDEALEVSIANGAILRCGDAYYDAIRIAATAREVRRIAGEYQKANPLAWGIGRAELQERLAHRGTKGRFTELLEAVAARSGPNEAGVGELAIHLRSDTVRVGTPDRQLTPADQATLEKFEALLRSGGASPPTPNDLQTQLGAGARFPAFVSLLEEAGALVKVGDSLFYHRAALDELDAGLRTYLASHAEMTMADFKDLTGLSRKFAVPLLEYFDRRGVTARAGDNRRPGPLLTSSS